MNRIIICVSAVLAVGAAGCGDSGGGVTPAIPGSGTPSRLTTAARSALAALGVRGILGNIDLVDRTSPLASPDFSLSDPADPTNQALLYGHVTLNADNSALINFYSDAAHTAAAGSTLSGPVQTAANGALPDSLPSQFNNVSSIQLTGGVTRTTTDDAGNGTLQFNNLGETLNGAKEALNGALTMLLGGVQTGSTATLGASSAPLTLTEGGQTLQLNLNNLLITQDPTSGKDTVTGAITVNSLDTQGDTANVQFNADGSATATINDNTGAKLEVENVDAAGNVTAVTQGATTGLQNSVSLGNIKTLNPTTISV